MNFNFLNNKTMTLHSVLDCLHSNDVHSIITMLNKAMYVETYDVKETLALHTGITFKIHSGKKFEVLYNKWEHDLLFQPCDPFFESPCIAGLLMLRREKLFFNYYDNKAIDCKTLSDDSVCYQLNTTSDEIINKAFNHDFEILDAHGNLIRGFPLSRQIPFIIYNGHNKFKLWEPNKHNFDN